MKTHTEPKHTQRSHAKRILIVDDHPIFREGITETINREPDLTVCGEAENAGKALELLEKLHPDLVLIDITLPGRSGLELAKDIHTLRPELPLFVVSMHDEALFGERVIKAGARGYLMKHEHPKTLINAIRQVLDGRVYLSPKLSDQLILSASGKRPAVHGSSLAHLTDREFEIFRLVGKGHDTFAISTQLHLSPKTVAVHKTNIKKKLGIPSTAELMRFAIYWDCNHLEPSADSPS